jgi:ATP-dependent protease HslVU (ClpYQ) peptidase subunit
MLGWVGVGLLVVAGLAILVEAVVAALWGAAVARHALTLSERLQTERALLESDLEKLRLALEEAQRQWRPYRFVLRWLQHPLVIALLASYRRRRLLR